jgi:hypothetical protein
MWVKQYSYKGLVKKMQGNNHLINCYYDFTIASKCYIILNDLIPFM